jgi:hypothetical protein
VAKPLPRLPSRHDLEYDALFRARRALAEASAPVVHVQGRRPVPVPDPARTADGLRAAAGFPAPPVYDDLQLVLQNPLFTPGRPNPAKAHQPAVRPAIRRTHLSASPAELMLAGA